MNLLNRSLIVLSALLIAAPAMAAKKPASGEAMLAIGTEPDDGFGTAVGFTLGGGIEVQKDLEARGELSYFNWSQTMQGVDVSYRRIPVGGGLRKYFPTNNKQFRPYAQGMLELSFDRAEVGVLGQKVSESEVRVGVVPAGGFDFMVNDKFSLGANIKWHLTTDMYFVFGFGGAVRF